ncbi:alpha/beta hydrolase-fold protein [Amycolatopsis pithecellobii]|uniref:Esterase n=1 Tax=Amycolatopsis pithecellobii TaxID=664692 RepID=A0A6N7Z784_9PSEU|nr:alpha/beta hydrolase-fold protein [Amycolatopsis pithecellobii]MTD57021.1 hypothetical protein [Amycolatopsis pithecellobii]
MWPKTLWRLAVLGAAVAMMFASATASADTALPAPYSGWNVQVAPIDGNDQVVHLSFDSPLLKRRVTNTVYLPDSYYDSGPKLPVMYVLHGTVLSPLDNCALNAVTSQETLVRMIGCGGGYLQDNLYDIPSQLSKMNFVAVSPDTDPNGSICQTCMWVDGRSDLLPNIQPLTASELPADSFLHQELYPLVESIFNVRSDRGGRGVMGFSMGGWAAALQGMIHPDAYSYIGYVSGGYDIKEPVLQSTIIEPVGYFRDQGYTTSLTDPVWWAQFNPRDIATNLKGADVAFLLSSGDGCLNPVELLNAPECQGDFSPVRSPSGSVLEQELSLNRTIAVNDLTAKGIPFHTVQTPGTHGANNKEMFATQIVPGANAKFAASTATPETFSYRTAIPRFSVWDYRIQVTRGTDGFLDLTGARTDGRALTLTGAGNADVTTPATFTPGQTYTVQSVHESHPATQQVTADNTGRLRFALDTGTGEFGTTAGSTPGTTTVTIS